MTAEQKRLLTLAQAEHAERRASVQRVVSAKPERSAGERQWLLIAYSIQLRRLQESRA